LSAKEVRWSGVIYSDWSDSAVATTKNVSNVTTQAVTVRGVECLAQRVHLGAYSIVEISVYRATEADIGVPVGAKKVGRAGNVGNKRD